MVYTWNGHFTLVLMHSRRGSVKKDTFIRSFLNKPPECSYKSGVPLRTTPYKSQVRVRDRQAEGLAELDLIRHKSNTLDSPFYTFPNKG